ncbi:two-component regulator propeller domain-containing protein [Ascidiimonas sp. W6]|uniref:two-component regulator propeller domain-containing protein n=1 Tax=Ascidiimonas meishanensis TaxID=3128903 RepID=UPI0030EBA4DD
MNKKILFYAFLFLTASTVLGQQFTSNFKVLDKKDGLSQITISTIVQDSNGFIWVGTQGGLNRYDGNSFKVFRSNPMDSTSLSNNFISDLAEDQEGNIWVSTIAGGVCKYDPRTDKFKRYIQREKDTTQISSNAIKVVYIDKANRIWIGHQKGLELYNSSKDIFEQISIGNNDKPVIVNDIVSDNEDNLWLATNTGLKLLNTTTKKIEKLFSNEESNPNSLSSNNINQVTVAQNGILWCLFSGYSINSINPKTGDVKRYFQNSYINIDENNPNTRFIYHGKSGQIWLATEFYGLVMFDPDTGALKLPNNESIVKNNFTKYQAFTLLQDNTGSFWVGTWENGLIHYSINSNPFKYKRNFFENPNDPRTDSFSFTIEDKDGFIWISTTKMGLIKLDPKTGTVTSFEELSDYLNINNSDLRVQHITQDKKGYIWLGTRSNGFIRLDPKTNKFKVFANRLDSSNQTGSNSFHIVKEAHDGIIWLASIGVLTAFNPETETYTTYPYNPKNDKSIPGPVVSAIYEDLNHNLWLGFYAEGLHRLDRKTGNFIKVNYEPNNIFDPDAKLVSCLFQSERDVLWIGTTGGLFKYNMAENTFKRYNLESGLPSNTIYKILEDEDGNLWVSTNDGISKFDVKNEIFWNYQSEDGLQQSEFNVQSGFKSNIAGLMYFGGPVGLNFFDPNAIKNNSNVPPIVLIEFKKYNTNGDFIEIQGVNYKNSLDLRYNERDFSVKMAALDYTNPSKNKYAYWLEGYNNNWVEIGTRNEITFTNLSPGDYTLRVKGTNNDGVWNEKGKSLEITILPPWWGTWWAYGFYIIAALSLLYIGYRYRINQLETVRLKELDEAKRTMYTNITHEFRTPLTVISGMNKELREQTKGNYKEYFDLIDRNSKNMLHLVNQLLELRKLEIGKMNVDLIQGNIIDYIKYISESFDTYAKTKDITVHFVCITEELFMDYDVNKLSMILSNLLSNAIKYSKPGEDVFLQVDELKDELQIRVVDSGQGIPNQELPRIFDRFYKVENNDNTNIDGVGIGLAVTKELVHLLKGSLTVSSKIAQGSIFTLTLPIQNNAPLAPVLSHTKQELEIIQNSSLEIGDDFNTKSLSSTKEALQLLIIEDNKDVLKYLITCLNELWHLFTAQDGQEGIDLAIEEVPDVILCDLMMPSVNGYKVLEILKNDPRTSHIPIVILTAKPDDDARIEAYKKGADAYLIKPFNKEELLIILEKLVQQRKLLQERYKSQTSLLLSENTVIRKEDNFIQKLETLVLNKDSKKLDNINDICEHMEMSRTQLHNKIKALTGKSTSIFIRSLRLQKAKHLLERTNKSISEIAYEVGFNNPSYFTKSFTEEFGLPPSSLRK